MKFRIMIKQISYSILFILLFLGSSCSKRQLNSSEHFSQGMKYDQKEERTQAIQEFTKAIEADSTNINAYIMRGHMFDKDGHPEIAIHDYNKAIELDPENPESYFYRGFSYMVAREEGSTSPENSVKDFTKAILLNISTPEVYYLRALAYDLMNDKKSAIADYKKYIFLVGARETKKVERSRSEILRLEKEIVKDSTTTDSN